MLPRGSFEGSWPGDPTTRSYPHILRRDPVKIPTKILRRWRSCAGSAKIFLARDLIGGCCLKLLDRTLVMGILENEAQILRRAPSKILHRYLALVQRRHPLNRSCAGPAEVSCRDMLWSTPFTILRRELVEGSLGYPAHRYCQEILSDPAKILPQRSSPEFTDTKVCIAGKSCAETLSFRRIFSIGV